MKKICLFFVGLFCFGAVAAQVPYDTVTVVDPQNFTLATTIDTALVQVISRKAGLNRRINFHTVKSYSTPDITLAWLGINIEDTTGIATTYRDFFVTDNEGEVWFVDNAGRARKLYDPAQFQDLTISDDTIYISDGNFAILPGIAGTTIDSISYHSDTLRIYEGGDTIPFKAEIVAGAGISDLNDLADVDTAGIGANDLLRWNGTDWVPVSPVQFIWEQNIPYGQGLTDRTAYYSNDTTLTYTAITYSATEWNAGALTGATGIASGTTAQRPAGVAGKMRFNSDLSDLEFYNGSAWRSLPESSANAFTAGQFIIANPAGILSDTTAAGVLSMIGGVGGTGASPQVAYWSGASTLTGHANFLWDGSQLSVGTTNSDYTLELGTGGLRIGGQSAAPTGASGVAYYDTDDNWFYGHNGTAFHFFARSDDVDPGAGRLWFQNSANTAQSTSSLLTWDGDQLGVNTSSLNQALAVNGNIRVRDAAGTGAGIIYLDATSTAKSYLSTGGGLRLSAGDASTTAVNFAYGNTVHGRFAMNGTIASAAMEAQNFTGYQNGDVTVKGRDPSGAETNHIILRGGYGATTTNTGGNTYIRGGYVNPSFFTDYNGVPGNVYIQAYADSNATVTSPLYTAMYIPYVASGVGKASVSMFGTFAPTSNLDINGKVRMRILPDSLYAYEVRADANGRLTRASGSFIGAISTSTDGSGDVTVTHGMGTTPTAVLVTPTGTTAWIVSVHTIGATTFKVRFFDAAGAAVTSTAVTATWLGKT